MGTFRSMAKDIMPEGMIPDEDAEDDDMPEAPESVNSVAATTSGSDLPAHAPVGKPSLGMIPDASHSTVIIRSNSQIAAMSEQGDVPALDEDGSSGENMTEPGPSTPPPPPAEALGTPPPPYIARTPRRASYSARMNTGGSLVRDVDLGTGVDTIRPIKKVDAAGSLRLSNEFVGSMREREGSASSPASPTSPDRKDKTIHERKASEVAKAGRAIVDDVVLPTLQKVCARFCELTFY
jgi:serine/threonine-protein kinase 24/25/MST4